MFKSKYFILRQKLDSPEHIVEVDGKEFIYFEVINDEGEIIDVYDNINIVIGESVRTDMMRVSGQFCVRFFPYWDKPHLLTYDESSHTIGYQSQGE